MPSRNPAIDCCVDAYHLAFNTEHDQGASDYDSRQKGISAYIDAMPTFNDHASICSFIACVTYAMLFNFIRENQASKLLYAAQVALGALRSASKSSDSTQNKSKTKQTTAHPPEF